MKENDYEYLMLILRHQIGIRDTLSEFGSYVLNDVVRSNMCVKALSVDVNQIGEYANRLTDEMKENLSAIDMRKAYNIRNRLAHGYTGVKPQEIVLTAFGLSSEASISQIKKSITTYKTKENKNISKQIKLNVTDEIKNKIIVMEQKGIFLEQKGKGKLVISEKGKDYLSQEDLLNIQKAYDAHLRLNSIEKGLEP